MTADIANLGVLLAAILLTLAIVRLALAVAEYFDRRNGKQ